MSNGIGHVWAVNAEGGDEGRPNGVGPVWIENADQLGSKLPEPEASDAGKVLGVLNAEGDIGWVPDQEGMAQVQSDWDQTDSSQVSYIANKPSLATVATTGAYSDLSGTPTIPTVDQTYDASSANAQSGVAVASALSSKQDTISDLSTIRSGAAAGATAVQPAALNDYATTSALTSGLAAKQDTISDLATIRSGASAGATAVQPGDLATVATTGSYNDLSNKPTIPSTKPLVAGTNITLTENTNDVTISAAGGASYSAGTGIDITNNVISADTTVLATKSDLSAYTPTASLATVATTGSYSDLSNKPTIPAVDQTYNAASTNAQSGAAVAQAIAAIPSTTYTAGNGIAVSSSKVISAVGGDGITVTGPSTSSVNLYAPTRTNGTLVSMFAPLTADLVSMIETGGLTVVPSIDLTVHIEPTVGLYVGICAISNYNLIDQSHRLVLGQVNLSVTYTQAPDPEDPEFLEDYYTAASNGATLVYDIDDLNSTLSNNLTWADVKASPSNYAIVLLFFGTATYCKVGSYDTGSSSASFNTGVYTTVTPGAITVTNPLPASAVGDAGKVLKVDSNGDPEWTTDAQADWTEADPSDPSYVQNKPDVLGFVAGSGISITESSSTITIAADAQIPAYNTTTDVGKVLQVTANGLAWVSLS